MSGVWTGEGQGRGKGGPTAHLQGFLRRGGGECAVVTSTGRAPLSVLPRQRREARVEPPNVARMGEVRDARDEQAAGDVQVARFLLVFGPRDPRRRVVLVDGHGFFEQAAGRGVRLFRRDGLTRRGAVGVGNEAGGGHG